jgi:hypothetical protein
MFSLIGTDLVFNYINAIKNINNFLSKICGLAGAESFTGEPMQSKKILLWDEVDHEKEFPWPAPKASPKEYITPPPMLASLPELYVLPLHMRKYLRGRKSCS